VNTVFGPAKKPYAANASCCARLPRRKCSSKPAHHVANVAVAEEVSALRTEEYFRERDAVPIAPKPCKFSNALEKGNPPLKGDHFRRNGRRNQAWKAANRRNSVS